jgi:hypothetical protein
MTFCPCWEICPTLKSSNFVTGISQGQNVIYLDHSGKQNDIHLDHSKVLRHHCTVIEFYFLQPGGRISLTWTVLDRMAPKRTILKFMTIIILGEKNCRFLGPKKG